MRGSAPFFSSAEEEVVSPTTKSAPFFRSAEEEVASPTTVPDMEDIELGCGALTPDKEIPTKNIDKTVDEKK